MNFGLGLSQEQIVERRKRLHAGDAGMVMSGQWNKLWRLKMGLDAEDDLSGEFRVQLGSFTEPFNLAWTQEKTGRQIDYYTENDLLGHAWHELTAGWCRERGILPLACVPEMQISKTYPFMACNLDALSTTPQGHRCVLDAKHVGQAGEAMLLRYTAPMTHQATVMGLDWWGLSIIVGNKWQEPIYQEVDPLYQAQLIAAEREFMGYVERGEEPADRGDAVALPPKPQPPRRTILLDQLTPGGTDWPNWADEFRGLARAFAETDGPAKKNAITREGMKKLVPDDVGIVKLGLVTYKRDGRGQTINLEKEKADAHQP